MMSVAGVGLAMFSAVAQAEVRNELRPVARSEMTVSAVQDWSGLQAGDQVGLVHAVRDPLPNERGSSPEWFILWLDGRATHFLVNSVTRGNCGETIYTAQRDWRSGGVVPMDLSTFNLRLVDRSTMVCEIAIPVGHLWEATFTSSYPFGGPDGIGHVNEFQAHGDPVPVLSAPVVTPVEAASFTTENVETVSGIGLFGVREGQSVRLVRSEVSGTRDRFTLVIRTGARRLSGGLEVAPGVQTMEFETVSKSQDRCGAVVYEARHLNAESPGRGRPTLRLVDSRGLRCRMFVPADRMWQATVSGPGPADGIISFDAFGAPAPLARTL